MYEPADRAKEKGVPIMHRNALVGSTGISGSRMRATGDQSIEPALMLSTTYLSLFMRRSIA